MDAHALIRRAAALMLGLLLLATGGGLAQAPENVNLLSVQSGHSVIVHAPSLQRLAVGDSRIAGVIPAGGDVVINGKSPGHTTVFLWMGGRRVTYEVTVTEQTMDQLAQMVRSSLNEPDVQVVSFNNSVVVRGTVSDGSHYQNISDVLGRFDKYAQQTHAVIVNAVTVAHPIGDLQSVVGRLPGATGIRVDPDGKGNVIVSGNVRDASTEQAILNRVRGLAGPYLASDGKIIDRISSDTTSQVSIRVYVMEVDRTALQDLGVQLQSAIFQPGGNSYVLGGPNFPAVENPVGPGKALTTGPFFRTITLAPTLNLLLTQGHARVLSSPNLVTTPGNEATFLVGGEVPIPYSTGLGQVAIQYKEFGVKLNVTPNILGNGGIEAKIAPEVSDLDFQDAIRLNGFTIPALRTSRLSTDVVAQPGESIIMGGMLRRQETRNITKIPGLADIPILGNLFKSVNYQNSTTDVVFVMTPELITR